MKKVIFYLIDGARPDVLQYLVKRENLPNIKKHLLENGSSTKGTTCFPSTTGPAYLPYLTGVFPGDHHITGIRWFDKSTFLSTNRWHRNSMRSYCGYEAKYFNEDMNHRYPSLFENIEDGINLYNMVTKGVKEENDITKDGKTRLYFNAHFKHRHHDVDKKGHLKLMDSLKRNASFTFAVFPSIDWDSHTYHYDDPETTHKAYEIVDDSLGEVVEYLKKDGIYEDTLIVMASDHGLSATHTHFDLGKFFNAYGYSVLEYPAIFTLFPNVAISISGNSFASISFLDKTEHYSFQALRQNHSTIFEALIKNDAIDFVVIRGDDDEIKIVNADGVSSIKKHGNKLSYYPETADVLQLKQEYQKLDFKSSFDVSFDSEYPDSLWQCYQLMSSDRAGDMIISASVGYDLRDFYEYPEHKGSHGSLHWEHMYVPILTNQKNLITEPMRTVEVHSMIKNWLSNGY